jgi:VIT1/CCC1 family predicted Fe2+/Mn2+ transporter
MGTVASARESLIGQLQTSSSSGVAKMIKEGYGDAWHANALWAGLFALSALVVGVVVLVRPAFGEPGRAQAPWIRSVAWAGVSLGVIGLLLAVLKYTDVLLGLPTSG